MDYAQAHANSMERQLEQHGPGEPVVTLQLPHDVYLRSYSWARVELRLPLPSLER